MQVITSGKYLAKLEELCPCCVKTKARSVFFQQRCVKHLLCSVLGSSKSLLSVIYLLLFPSSFLLQQNELGKKLVLWIHFLSSSATKIGESKHIVETLKELQTNKQTKGENLIVVLDYKTPEY